MLCAYTVAKIVCEIYLQDGGEVTSEMAEKWGGVGTHASWKSNPGCSNFLEILKIFFQPKRFKSENVRNSQNEIERL